MPVNKMLCISSVFPPVVASGGHRTKAVVRFLPAHGWHPVVVTMRPMPSDTTDLSLLEGLPDDLDVYRALAPDLLSLAVKFRSRLGLIPKRRRSHETRREELATMPTGEGPARSLTDWASWWLQVPDVAVGWLPGGLVMACRALQTHRCQAIYSSAPYWTTHLIGLLTKRLSGLPWVADFRDPWRANPFRNIPYRSVSRFDAWLEERVVREADRVVCNSESIREDFIARFPERSERFVTIPNGFDPEDFAGLEARRPTGRDRLVMTHAGGFYGPRRPDALFQALRLFRDRGNGIPKPCLQLVGPPVYEGKCLNELAAQYEIKDFVELTGQVDHRHALELMRGSDIQLLVGFNGPGAELQVPAKLFEYMGVGRPVLALAPERSAISEILKQSGITAELCNPDDPEAIVASISRLAGKQGDLSGGMPALSATESSIARFYRREQVGRIAELLGELC